MNFIDLKVVARTKANAINNKQCRQDKLRQAASGGKLGKKVAADAENRTVQR